MVNKKAKTINLKANSNREFFLIHGYTGSPMDFGKFPWILHKKFNANVKVICLKGHGTKIEDLDNITYEDFLKQIRNELKKDLKKGREIIIGGYSLGALFALILAAEYPIRGIIDIVPPYLLKFPFKIKGLEFFCRFKKYLDKTYWKEVSGQVEQSKEYDFSYRQMHSNGLIIVKKANKELGKRLGRINCPIISIHVNGEPIGKHESLDAIHNKIKSIIKGKKFINTRVHNVFYSGNNSEIYPSIINFVKDNNLFEGNKNNKITAIVPSYNESENIGDVLEILTKVNLLDEIIVVDDGSSDHTKSVVKKFRNVKYIKNSKNIGKAASMDKGVKSTDADIIFFCDADLIGLKKEDVNEIINPVKNGDFNMFIGLRGNFRQRTVHLFAINSGERAIRRIVWEKLPKYFKHKYRIEAGLNYYVNKYFGDFGYKQFCYSQKTKERKYGFIKGILLRWAMYFDVLSSYISYLFIDIY